MQPYFTEIEAAKRYDQYRPKVHGVIKSWLRRHCGERRFARALDIACGTGDSTLPLLDLADEVIGIDASSAMLKHAKAKGIVCHQIDYTAAPNLGKFDLLATCMAFHWFDADEAVAAYKAASTPDAIWLVYNFAFGGHATNEDFNRWLREQYLHAYPSPPRNRSSGVITRDDPEIDLVAEQRGSIPVQFSPESLVGYLTTQSNIENAVRQGQSYRAIAADLLASIEPFDLSGDFNYRYSYEIHRFQPTRPTSPNP